MKVLMVVSSLKYGWGTHVNPLMARLQEIGVDVELFNLAGNISTVIAPLFHKNKADEFDLVHIQGSPYNVFNYNRPTVTTVHTLLKDEFKHTWGISTQTNVLALKMYLAKPLEKRSLQKSDKIIAVNKCLVQDIQKIAPEVPITVIPNGIEIQNYSVQSPLRNDSLILSGGRLIPRKGFNVFLDAVQKLEVPSAIFGAGPLMKSLKSRCRIKDTLLGYTSFDELVQHYHRATMFVCASTYETGPFTVIEAMAAGCPVICSDIPAVKNLVYHGKTGLLFEPGNAKDLRHNIENLLEDQELRNSLAENAFNFVLEHHNWKQLAQRTKQVYEEVL